VMHVPSQCSHADVQLRALGVGHGLKTLLPHRILLVTDQKYRDCIAAVSARCFSHKEVSATCAVYSTPMTVAIHGSVGLRGITKKNSNLNLEINFIIFEILQNFI
jgi:hypothetical protein